jgi:hypothetical protein
LYRYFAAPSSTKQEKMAGRGIRPSFSNSCPFFVLTSFRLGYNHAHECRPVTMADVDKVKSKENSPYLLRHAKL